NDDQCQRAIEWPRSALGNACRIIIAEPAEQFDIVTKVMIHVYACVPAAGFRRDNLVADVIVTQISRLRPGTDFSSARTGCDVEESGTAGNRRRTATDLHGREGAIGVEPARSETTIGSDGGAIVELGIACPIRRQQRAIVERFVPVVEFA